MKSEIKCVLAVIAVTTSLGCTDGNPPAHSQDQVALPAQAKTLTDSKAMETTHPDTPAELLRQIYTLSLQEDYEQISELVYPGHYAQHDARKEAVAGIRKRVAHRDWAYSDESLKELIDHHLPELQPVSADLLKRLFLDGGSFGEDQTLHNIAQTQPEKITAFDYQDAHILIVDVDGKQQLVFWENLTNLAPKR